MKRIFAVLAILALTMALPLGTVAQDDKKDNVYVGKDYLIDSDGTVYGATYYLTSTVNEITCVTPASHREVNVNGSVTSPFQLQPNEEHVKIGQFIAADRSKDWSVSVTAKWKKGTC